MLADDVYKILRELPQGRVVTYGQIAGQLGNKNLARAVGNALHRNSNPDVIPCYKVINAAGRLSSAYAFGGILEQKRRLQAEGIAVINNCVDFKKYGYKR